MKLRRFDCDVAARDRPIEKLLCILWRGVLTIVACVAHLDGFGGKRHVAHGVDDCSLQKRCALGRFFFETRQRFSRVAHFDGFFDLFDLNVKFHKS